MSNFLQVIFGNNRGCRNERLGCFGGYGNYPMEDLNSCFGVGYPPMMGGCYDMGGFGYGFGGRHSALRNVLCFTNNIFENILNYKTEGKIIDMQKNAQACGNNQGTPNPMAGTSPYGYPMSYGGITSTFGLDLPMFLPTPPQISGAVGGGTQPTVPANKTVAPTQESVDQNGNRIKTHSEGKNVIIETYDKFNVLTQREVDYNDGTHSNHPKQITKWSAIPGTTYHPGEEIKLDVKGLDGYKVKVYTDGKGHSIQEYVDDEGYLRTSIEGKPFVKGEKIDPKALKPYDEKSETLEPEGAAPSDNGSDAAHVRGKGHKTAEKESKALPYKVFNQKNYNGYDINTILQDTDGDGKYDQKEVYMQKHNDDAEAQKKEPITYQKSKLNKDGGWDALPDKSPQDSSAPAQAGSTPEANQQKDYRQLLTSKENALWKKWDYDKNELEESRNESASSEQDSIEVGGYGLATYSIVTPYGKNPDMAKDFTDRQTKVLQEERDYRYFIDKLKPQFAKAIAAYESADRLYNRHKDNQLYKTERDRVSHILDELVKYE